MQQVSNLDIKQHNCCTKIWPLYKKEGTVHCHFEVDKGGTLWLADMTAMIENNLCEDLDGY